MQLIFETKSYQNSYYGTDIIKSNSSVFCPTWWDAMEWVDNYRDELDSIARSDQSVNIKIRTTNSEAFLYNTVAVIWHRRGIDTVYIRMAW